MLFKLSSRNYKAILWYRQTVRKLKSMSKIRKGYNMKTKSFHEKFQSVQVTGKEISKKRVA